MKIRIYKQGTWTVVVPRECSIDDKETVLKYWDYEDALRRAVRYIRDYNTLLNAKRASSYRVFVATQPGITVDYKPFRTNLYEDR
jgi:hypothetical protein